MKPSETEWIASILESSEGVRRAEMPDGLMERIAAASPQTTYPVRKPIIALSPVVQRWAVAASIVGLIGLNILSVQRAAHTPRNTDPVGEAYFSYLK